MSTLAEMLRETADLQPAESEWLHLLVGDWQLVADLSFADLVLWVRGGLDGWRAVAHVRPNTGPMVFYDDIVGRTSTRSRAAMLDDAARERRLVTAPSPMVREDMSVREDAVPVVHEGRVVAVVTRHANLTGGRTPSRLELTYHELADAILTMVATGEFPPTSAPTGLRRGAPRVGDGVIHLDAEGVIRYASPNAVSAVHRMGHVGDVVGETLAKIVTDLVAAGERQVDETLAVVVMGRASWRTEVETASATVTMRAVPLTRGGVRQGAMILLRDVSELRRREQELLTKDATIREIHHRVKNNLQTVAALLRLQGRRVPEENAKAALEEAVRRVATIALVHETLSTGFDETVSFDEIALRGLRAVVEVATREHHVDSRFEGTFGRVRAEDATALAMVMSELVQNAVEHGLADRDGTVVVRVERRPMEGGDDLTVSVTDDGAGLPAGFRPGLAGLGTRIVTSFVQDLRGRIRWENVEPRGTRVEFVARLRPLR
ncbi:histidine kinase N-terminal domain-containing protein [Phycicoccus endophyticus]|uniref:histidine kinase n=1 Tax=Phycicoccus endophyticus TaxID=1690220 RepID=A0A7G9R375_9MICO|nr:PAS domain-containing sensor histidine kinase [Phycicoccus endophyticus]NHI19791.1 PAS domain-containing protein [Phycicoccus endophyticus]QNN50050.1 histidine kinase N-terminal domain-containing protein [Phycicoccus endophyticus]GGL28560.1 histidine kinase [Phycicoccus endophyticus]